MFEAPVDPVVAIEARSPVTTRPLRAALAALTLLLLAGATWMFLGQAPRTVGGAGILEPGSGYIEIDTPASGELVSVDVSPGDKVTAGQIVAVVNATGPAAQTVKVYAPRPGVIADVVARPGRLTKRGDSLAYLAPSGSGLAMWAFVPARLAKAIEPGMPARIQVSTAPSAQYGFIEGEVRSVAPSPATPEGMLYTLLGNPDLVEHFSASGPVVEVAIDLPPANTPSGFRWTIGDGPGKPITFGAMADVSVVTDRGSILQWLVR